MVVDNDYERYNIGKLPRNKYSGEGNSSVTILRGGTSSDGSVVNNTVVKGIDGHYLWGQFYDDTKDIEGTLSNVQDINMDGDLNITEGNINLTDGNIEITDGDITQTNGKITTERVEADNIEAGTVDTDEVNSNRAEINQLDTTVINNSGTINTLNLTATGTIQAPYGNINHFTADDIHTENLTVTGSAHFFELVIDQIKSAGGAFILTPADGFQIFDYEINDDDEEITLYWLAEDENNQVRNMWRIGDQALIQDFNKAHTGTSYDVNNTYFWGIVTGVSSTPITVNDKKANYIHVSYANGDCDGDYSTIYVGANVVMLGHRQQTGETPDQAKERQTAIYMAAYTPSSGAYDPDLLAPFIIYYEGINDFDLPSHKVQWWSSGTRNANVPQNRMVGSFLLTTGQTIQQYIDENIKDADINMITLEGGSNIWLVNTDSNYSIVDTSQTWTTRINIYLNGNIWHIGNNSAIQVYAVNGNTEALLSSGYSIVLYDDSGNVIPQSSSTPAHSFDITFTDMSTCIPGWYTTENRIIRIKVGTYTPNDYTTMSWRNYDVECVKLAKGQNGSATQVAMTQYSLVPVREDVYVDANGAMLAKCIYNLKYIHTDAQGNTVINTNASIPSGYNLIYDDDAGIKQGLSATIFGSQFVISIDNYFAGTSYTDYQAAWPDHAPTYIRIYLNDGNTNIDRRIIPVRFLAGSVFDVKEDSIRLAIAGAQGYTDNSISTVNQNISTVTNRVSSLELNLNGVQTRVGNVETSIDNVNNTLAQKADTSYVDQTATNITSTVTSQIIGVQGDINNLNTALVNRPTRTEMTSTINQSATQITANVTQNVEGKLTQTGIDIENQTITLTTDNLIAKNNEGEKVMWMDSKGNMTLRGTINNLITIIDVLQDENADLLIDADEDPNIEWQMASCTNMPSRGYDTLDILRAGDVIKIRSTNERNITLPFYMYEGVAWDGQEHDFYLRTTTKYGDNLHLITTDEMLEMVGRKITIISNNSSQTSWLILPSVVGVAGVNSYGTGNDYSAEYAIRPQPIGCVYDNSKVPEFVGWQLNAYNVIQLECRLGECVIDTGTTKLASKCIYWAPVGYSGQLFNWN